MLLALLLAFPLSSSALPTATDFTGRCQSEIPLRSPEEVFKAHNITLATACPIQSSVDKNHECQDSADSLQDLWVALKGNRTVACNEASKAAAKAQQDCQGQASCVAAQAAAVKSFQAALQTEIAAIKKYIAETDKVLKYANDAIAGGGVDIVKIANQDKAKNPDGKDGTAGWLKAASNQDAVSRVLADEDEGNARAVVNRFLKDGAQLSDISSIRSSLIREPLQLVAAGTEWKKELVAYKAQEEGKSDSLSQQAATLKTSGTNFADNSGVSGSGGSQIASSTDGLTAASKAMSSAGQIASLSQAGSGSGSTGAYDPGGNSAANMVATAATRSAPSGTYFSGSSAATSVQAGNGKADSTGAGSQTVAALVPNTDAARSEGKTSTTGSSSSLRSQLAARLAAHSSASSGSDGEKGIDSAKASSRSPASATAAGSGAAALADGAANTDGGTGDVASSFTPALIPVASESNENAVKSLVGAWEKSLAPEGAVAASPEMPGAASEPLFGRVRLAHERALRRGSIQRTLAPKL
jgi:hypothetical protein